MEVIRIFVLVVTVLQENPSNSVFFCVCLLCVLWCKRTLYHKQFFSWIWRRISVRDTVISESALILSTDTSVQGSERYPSEVGLLVWDKMKRSVAQKVGLKPNKYQLNPQHLGLICARLLLVLEPIDSSYNQYGLVPVPPQSSFVKIAVCQTICIGGGSCHDAGLNLRSVWLSYGSDDLFIVSSPNVTALPAESRIGE
jgi:hypothetical protein